MNADNPQRVSFDADGTRIVGHLHVPSRGGDALLPALVVAGPSPSVKEQVADHYGARLAAAGYLTLTIDPRNFGDSDGQPRQREDPAGKLLDLQTAISYLRGHDRVDPARIGAVGVCAGAGYALKLAAFDRRVAAFVGIAGFYPSPDQMRADLGPETYIDQLKQLAAVIERQNAGGPTEYLPHVAPEGELAFMVGGEPYQFYGTERAAAPGYRNELTVDTGLALLTLDNAIGADFLGPTPGLIVHGKHDVYATPERAQAIFDRLTGPKGLVWLEAENHIDLYDGPDLVQAATNATTDFLASTAVSG